jgi:hypothetical protein
VTTSNSLGEGVRFDNCQNAEIVNVAVQNPGQDGLVFFTASGTGARAGAHATNISVTGSHQRGISVLGATQVTVGGFRVDGSTSTGIFCGTSSGSGVPDEVIFQGGLVTNTGGYGIEFDSQNSCSFANIHVDAAGSRGVSGSAPAGTAELRNIRVTNNTSGDAFNFTSVKTVLISDSSAEDSPGYGFFFEGVSNAVTTALSTLNVAQANSLHRAIWFQNGGTVISVGSVILDSQTTASGYVIGTTGMSKGSLHGVASSIARGALQVQNSSPGVSVSLIN